MAGAGVTSVGGRGWYLARMQKVTPPIVVITTGGTIDKAYFDALSAYKIGEPMVKKMLDVANVTRPFRVVEMFRKDSLDLTDQDRRALYETVAALDTDRVVITARHGHHDRLGSRCSKPSPARPSCSPARCRRPASRKAMRCSTWGWLSRRCRPYPQGVYVAMSGQVFRGDEVRKDREHARFVSTAE